MAHKRVCPQNMIYESCGTACPLTCEFPELRPCIRMCVPGCFCKDGYLLDDNGKCVTKCYQIPKEDLI